MRKYIAVLALSCASAYAQPWQISITGDAVTPDGTHGLQTAIYEYNPDGVTFASHCEGAQCAFGPAQSADGMIDRVSLSGLVSATLGAMALTVSSPDGWFSEVLLGGTRIAGDMRKPAEFYANPVALDYDQQLHIEMAMTGGETGFTWTPQPSMHYNSHPMPEPSTLWLCAIALACAVRRWYV